MDVLLVSDQDDFEAALPALKALTHTMRRAALQDDGAGRRHAVDAAIVDARSDLAAARAVCRRLTSTAPGVAVVVVVAPTNFVAVDIDWHCDDVLLPAAGADELEARLRLAIKRRRNAVDGTLKFGDLLLHPATFAASLGGKELGLTATEFKLLNFLVQHAGRAFSRTRLMHEVWGYDSTGRVRTVDVHVRRLRAKLGTQHESMIDTVRGVGYMALTPPQPQWIFTDPVQQPAWASADEPASDAVAR
ncbi:transcriptional regulator [Mycobacterium shigaense]|uniref:Transcriptional regulator n=1 Tax=Mycobacterium shigaense TaxID=722731 RepID=A0A1Z4EFV2_9MYCO|nr:transcriptional regulator [Mycobacterium shigaense]BAX91844.1 transcriptional regulator [Mycobacterium shigaense]